MSKPLIIAHRGSHGPSIAENTLRAAKAAIQNKADALECDVHQLRDKYFAVIHDSNLKRLTGKNIHIQEISTTELKNYPLIAGEEIPVLTEILAAAKEAGIPTFVELKSDHAEKYIDQAVDDSDPDLVILMSFDPLRVRHCTKKMINHKRGLLVLSNRRILETLIKRTPKDAPYTVKGFLWQCAIAIFPIALTRLCGANFIAPEERLINKRFILRAHAAGLKVYPWTVNEPKRIREFFSWGVDGIITDDVPLAHEIRAGLPPHRD